MSCIAGNYFRSPVAHATEANRHHVGFMICLIRSAYNKPDPTQLIQKHIPWHIYARRRLDKRELCNKKPHCKVIARLLVCATEWMRWRVEEHRHIDLQFSHNPRFCTRTWFGLCACLLAFMPCIHVHTY